MTPSSRRAPLRSSAGAAGSVDRLPGRIGPSRAARQEATPSQAEIAEPNAVLCASAPDDTVMVAARAFRDGPGIWTTYAMLVAEELEVDWCDVRRACTASPDFAHPVSAAATDRRLEHRLVGGSIAYRQAGAMARECSCDAAAARWKVAPADCRAEGGIRFHGGERAVIRLRCAADAAALAPPQCDRR